jgi:hypothetical protein
MTAKELWRYDHDVRGVGLDTDDRPPRAGRTRGRAGRRIPMPMVYELHGEPVVHGICSIPLTPGTLLIATDAPPARHVSGASDAFGLIRKCEISDVSS